MNRPQQGESNCTASAQIGIDSLLCHTRVNKTVTTWRLPQLGSYLEGIKKHRGISKLTDTKWRRRERSERSEDAFHHGQSGGNRECFTKLFIIESKFRGNLRNEPTFKLLRRKGTRRHAKEAGVCKRQSQVRNMAQG